MPNHKGPNHDRDGANMRKAGSNLEMIVSEREACRDSKVLHGEGDGGANDEQRQRMFQAIGEARMGEGGDDADGRKALGEWRRIPGEAHDSSEINANRQPDGDCAGALKIGDRKSTRLNSSHT